MVWRLRQKGLSERGREADGDFGLLVEFNEFCDGDVVRGSEGILLVEEEYWWLYMKKNRFMFSFFFFFFSFFLFRTSPPSFMTVLVSERERERERGRERKSLSLFVLSGSVKIYERGKFVKPKDVLSLSPSFPHVIHPFPAT